MAGQPSARRAVFATLKAKEGRGDEVVAAFESALPSFVDEPGTLAYSLHRSRRDGSVFLLYEVYADKDSLKAHSESAGMQAFLEALEPVLDGSAALEICEPVSGFGQPG